MGGQSPGAVGRTRPSELTHRLALGAVAAHGALDPEAIAGPAHPPGPELRRQAASRAREPRPHRSGHDAGIPSAFQVNARRSSRNRNLAAPGRGGPSHGHTATRRRWRHRGHSTRLGSGRAGCSSQRRAGDQWSHRAQAMYRTRSPGRRWRIKGALAGRPVLPTRIVNSPGSCRTCPERSAPGQPQPARVRSAPASGRHVWCSAATLGACRYLRSSSRSGSPAPRAATVVRGTPRPCAPSHVSRHRYAS